MKNIRNSFQLLFVYLVTLASPLAAKTKSLIIDLNDDSIPDRVEIVAGKSYNLNGYKRAIPPRGYDTKDILDRELVVIKLSNGQKYYIAFPFADRLTTPSQMTNKREFRNCLRQKVKGFFAFSEEGAFFIYYLEGKIHYSPCFL